MSDHLCWTGVHGRQLRDLMPLPDVAALGPEDWATVVFKPHPTFALISLRCNTLSLCHALDQELDVPPVEAAALQAMLQSQSFAETCTLLSGVCCG